MPVVFSVDNVESRDTTMFGTKCLTADLTLCRVNTWIWKIVPMICFTVGTFGNSLNIAILSRKDLRSKPCVILIFVAVADLLCLCSVLVGDALKYGYGVRLKDQSFSLCVANTMAGYISAASSIWVVAIFTTGRMMFVLLPHQSKIHLNRNRSMVLAVSVIALVTTLFLITFVSKEGPGNVTGNKTMDIDAQNLTSCLTASDYNDTTAWILETSTVISCVFVPILIIVIGNTILVVGLCRRPNQTEADSSQISLLLAITGLLVITTLPYGMFYLIMIVLQDQIDVSSPVIGLIHAVIENLGYCNYALNFFCYLWKSSLFKTEFNMFLKEMKSAITRS